MLAFVMVPAVHSQTSQADSEVSQAYAAVLSAERSGGNVTSLVAQLNTAISLLQEADRLNSTDPALAASLYTQAYNSASHVLQAAPGVASAGAASVRTAQVELGVETVVLVALAALAYLYIPRLFWRYWSRTHSDWRVKKP
ncbi:MAG: hypothetical protein JRM80_01175 [Nitrososphaerota archaeon]|jgi:hypothetical protein|nr:hypothetical protein [Nitrososphaerota archaeon]MDG6938173.1 hypothetical protein [Nitrososphaerota archaeon]MDG6960224.1 hypothetical protein [Nitrososphaerota archaeon]MDG6965590.1 hypothetical protein [Nitrososphaerota archaeon]MDG7014869.1 hypothetical protein [Nitrososphaerota archaeon]